MRARHKARELALQTLYAADFNGTLGNDASPDFAALSEDELKTVDQEVVLFARFLVNGTIEHLAEIDEIIGTFSTNRPVEKIDLVDRNILRMSIFSFLFMKEIHPHIVIDEAVKLSQDFSTEVNYKFINGILDSIRKSLESTHDTTQNS